MSACPECLQGKHDNCDGTTWDIVTDQPAPCPCGDPIHTAGHALLGVVYPEAMGTAVLGDIPTCTGHCGQVGSGEDTDAWVDDDCPIHGDVHNEPPAVTDIDTGGLL